MSQPGKVLHVYVEVRSTSDPSAGGKTFREGPPLDHLKLKDNTQDLLCQLASRSPTEHQTLAPKALHRCPSSHSGGSPLTSSSRASERWSLPCDTKPSTMSCSNSKEGRDGKRSVVSFSYVQKSKVKTISGPGNGQERAHQVHKRLCEPFWFGSPKLTFPPSGSRHAVDTTGKTLEDFGSPLLKLKAAHAPGRATWSRTCRSGRCRSLSRSPALIHQERWGGRPQSPGSDWRPLPSPSSSPRPADIAEGLNQLSDVPKRSAPRWIHPKESGPTCPQQSLEMNIPVHAAASDAGRPFRQPGRLPLPPRLHRPSHPPTELGSPLRDPGVSLAELRPPDSPTLHRRRTPQYTGADRRASGCQERGDRSELTRKAFARTEGTPAEKEPSGAPNPNPVPDGEQTGGGLPARASPTTPQKRAERRRRERLLLGPVVPDSPDEEREHPLAGSWPSSSGVTGSLGERECLSPESLQSGETRASTSGIQTDSATPVLSLHCQKMARAKWEFLFGPEEGAGSGPANFVDTSTAPPSGNSSESPTPTPPSSLPTLAASHHVRHVEVELVTPSPETGVIRRSLKYSETDLDAVPLRCYRETDIDELLTGGRDDRDSAFGSDRSLRGGSPGGSGPRPRKGKVEEAGSGEGERDEDQWEEVVSWASVRMRGDERKRRDAAWDQERGFPRMKKAAECFSDRHQAALKSPVRLRGPGRAAEDAFSRHFESVVESARAKGTSYRSLDDPDSDATRPPSSERLSGGSEDTPPGRRGYSRPPSPSHEFGRRLADQYLRLSDFSGLPLDGALRAFLKQVALLGGSPERERLLWHFSRRYSLCNQSHFPSEDAVLALTWALVALNADLHGPNVCDKMSCPQFVSNLDGLNDGRHFPKHLLKALYNSIKTQKLQWTLDEEELRKSFSELGDSLCDSSRSAKGGGGDDDDDDDDETTADEAASRGPPLYKNGFLVRKVHADSDGKRTPRGKRGWKTFYAILKGLILYLQKGEYRADKPLTDDDLKNAVSIHHSLAIQAADYSKRANVFYLRTADWRLFLFQAPNAEQMHSWITSINTVAATFSAPPLPPAVGSQKKFSRPPLPGNVSKLSQEEQLRSHEARLRAVSSELAELRSCPPQGKLKATELERDQHLHFEKTRYETYVALLRAETEAGPGAEPGGEPEDEGAFQRARSSPSLPDCGQAGGTRAGGKPRQDVQRHSYRQAVKK
ncbi:PH and SEC7 domain-containing protein 1-like isoform X1 [Syngnathus acus]|uniref:PH and SEC7 domain-containing protein 1-like isoform X1 n=1 Tax=Syngnathus acus TaxID=161584 RepID=UPI001885D5FC|nr:PH and SEC7 domain-containing protein 1-like isoform X1 [Syngnathus acus]